MYVGVKEIMESLPDIKLEEAKTIIKNCREKNEQRRLLCSKR